MSFVQNGSFEALAQASANTNNTSTDSNPFGLKDFARVLDAKFGNSAFSDNLLAAPSGTIKSTNPFDRQAMDKIDSSPYQGGRTAVKKTEAKTETGGSGNDHSEAYNSAPSSIFSGFNKGTGMARGGKSKHKLDFCY